MTVMLLLFVKIQSVSRWILYEEHGNTAPWSLEGVMKISSLFKAAINAMAVSPVILVLVSHVPTKTNVQDKFVTSLKILIASILKFGLHIKLDP